MRKPILGLAVILTLTFSTSCQQTREHDHGHDHAHEQEHAHEGEHKHEEGHAHEHTTAEEANETSHGLVLNDGAKWTANTETTEGVHNMKEIMDAFTETDDVAAYLKLTDDLNAEFGMIFEKCTMTGEAHNQLHMFLMPIKATFAQLSSSDIEMCRKSHTALRAHLDVYDEFFE